MLKGTYTHAGNFSFIIISIYFSAYFLFSEFFSSSEIINKSSKKFKVLLKEKVSEALVKIEEYLGRVMSPGYTDFSAEITSSSLVP